ncbi:3-oxoacyl-ACP synthase [Carbonactinospora thermoautotrophica]|uniref:3-oxoacyl-[acyl-carrier-protein] synthase 2 n=3 Tax=Carbonactinospora thermoautotrophica TaxID=1469144 RepID=A0A132MVD5_9ACTN|nr:beta-ketoacyl-ACP synthase II [Carbonactinospora thermoautotrophica]KWX00154.1 3-oxoacyl-ACP synthase [Carbonactinospora thermoautotrophica]KWX01865.1 3-oxoacyl-(acyl-carrier-protein) synthase [Carbonactinospora thermoautotrophica]
MRKVVVTGLGATTPVGGDVATTWSGLLAGKSGVRRLTEEWAEQLPVQIAAPAAVEPTEVMDRVEARKLDRSEQMALIAAREAWRDAGAPEVDRDRLGVAVASGIGGAVTLLNAWDAMKEKGPRRVSPHTIPAIMPNGPAAWVGLEFGARAGVHATVSACASSNEAIAYGMEMIRSGRADVVVAGGAEAVIHPLPIAAFAAMMALSKRNDEPERASRPWDKGRDGFVLGEGAAVVVLEAEEHARARGARIYCELAGAGMSADGHHIAQPEPEGRGAARAMRFALADAGLTPDLIAHVNAHATSTPQGDVAEVKAIRAVLGEHADNVVLTSTKSMTGHLLGAAGALEAVATILAVYEQVAPPTINLDDPDDEVDLTIARGEPYKLPDGDFAALNNSFGFGGHNIALVFRRYA